MSFNDYVSKEPVDTTPTPKPLEPITKPLKLAIEEVKVMFRRKPLLVHAEQVHAKQVGQISNLGVNVDMEPGDWIVNEGGHTTIVPLADFDGLYEIVRTPGGESAVAGLAESELGTEVDKDGKRMVRVKVVGGKGSIAYWHRQRISGADANWEVIADNIDNHMASHRVGRFIEPFEGKIGLNTWVFVDAR